MNAFQLAQSPNREYAEATIEDGSIITHSGSDKQTVIGGYNTGIAEANRLAAEVGFSFRNFSFATHAEAKLLGILNYTKGGFRPIGVSRPMCYDCQQFFQAVADRKGVTLTVADPEAIHVFRPK